jgi:hypothetical protein
MTGALGDRTDQKSHAKLPRGGSLDLVCALLIVITVSSIGLSRRFHSCAILTLREDLPASGSTLSISTCAVCKSTGGEEV